MSIFKSALKILLRSKLILAVYTVFTVFFIYKAIDFYTPDIIHYESNLLQFSVYAFAIFAFLGFEYCVKCKKSNMDECLKAMKNGFFKWSTAELKCMLIPISAFAGVALCIHLIVFFTGETAFFSYLPRLLADLLLNYFLLPLTGAVFGLFFANFTNRLIAYLLLVLITLLGSPLITGLDAFLYETIGWDLSFFFKLFDFYPADLNFVPVYDFGISLLPHRWGILLFWILFLFCIIYFKTSSKTTAKKLFKIAVPAVLAAVCLITALSPASKILRASYNMTESVSADEIYYDKHPSDVIPKNPGFKITEYNADLRAFLKLSATVTMTVDNTDLEEYAFTLYHGYKVKSAKDQNGNTLNFAQDGDFLTVYTQEKTKTITLKYSGFSTKFYSNVQGLFLPGYFPYLPQSGFRTVYSYYEQDTARLLYDEDAQFHIKIHTPGKVYSNLKETERNTFSGKGNPTFLCGLYDEYITENGIRVIYQYMDKVMFNTIGNIESETERLFGMPCLDENTRTIFIIPDTNLLSPYLKYADLGDYILCNQITSLETLYSLQTEPENKSAAKRLYENYIFLADGQERNQYISFLADAQNLDGKVSVCFSEFITKYGEEEGLERVKTYLEDESDTRTSYEFFSDELGV